MYTMQNAHNVLLSADITINKNRVKKHGDRIYLPNDTEFEVELKNNSDSRILVKIKMDGKFISTSGIVLRPAEHVFLERFLDDNKKFLFSTYMVGNTESNKQIIAKNGDIEILCYKENVKQLLLDSYPNNWRDSTIDNSGIPDWTYTPYYTTDTMDWCISDDNVTYSVFNASSVPTSNVRSDVPLSKKSKLETGRVEEGGHSEQKFKTVSGTFESHPSMTVTYKLLPDSQRPITSKDLSKKYCSQCGKSCKFKDKFCSKCGNKL